MSLWRYAPQTSRLTIGYLSSGEKDSDIDSSILALPRTSRKRKKRNRDESFARVQLIEMGIVILDYGFIDFRLYRLGD